MSDDLHAAQDNPEGDAMSESDCCQVLAQVGEKMTGLGSSNSPRPVVQEVLAVYFLSIVLDSPNWIIFETKVLEYDKKNIIKQILKPCEGHNELGYENCWSYDQKRSICDNPMWMIVVILQCVLAKIIPGISILVMNVIIIVKVSHFSKCTIIHRYTPISWLQCFISAEKDLEEEAEAVCSDEKQRALPDSAAWLQ